MISQDKPQETIGFMVSGYLAQNQMKFSSLELCGVWEYAGLATAKR